MATVAFADSVKTVSILIVLLAREACKTITDPIITKLLKIFQQLTSKDKTLLAEAVEVRSLTPSEAIGNPGDWDFPLLRGKETLLQANFRNSCGQVFTGSPTPFQGKLEDVLQLDLSPPQNRAIFISVFNAFLRDQNMIEKTIHCKNSEPEECGKQIAAYIKKNHDPKIIGVAGYQPALISSLLDIYNREKILVTDLSDNNINKVFMGIVIQDGMTTTDDLIASSSLLLVTGSVFTNKTEEPFYNAYLQGKPIYFFGTSVSGIAKVLELPHLCPLGS